MSKWLELYIAMVAVECEWCLWYVHYYWCRLHRLMCKKPSNQIYMSFDCCQRFIEHLLRWIYNKYSPHTTKANFRKKSATSSKPIKYQRNCVCNSLFLLFQFKTVRNIPYLRKRLHSLAHFSTIYDLVLCADRRNIVVIPFRVMSVNVFVWVLFFQEPTSVCLNLVHFENDISKSHKWKNNSPEIERKKMFVIFILFFLIVRNHNHIMRDNRMNIIFEQFTVLALHLPCVQMFACGCALLYNFFFISSSVIQSLFNALFFQLCVNRLLMSTTTIFLRDGLDDSHRTLDDNF